MAAGREEAEDSGKLPRFDAGPDAASATSAPDAAAAPTSTETPGGDSGAAADTVGNSDESHETVETLEADEAGAPDAPDDPGEMRPEDVPEGVVDLVAYTVGALALIALGYFTQRDVLTWTRGPFTVVVIIMAVHWAGRRAQARRKSGATGRSAGNPEEAR